MRIFAAMVTGVLLMTYGATCVYAAEELMQEVPYENSATSRAEEVEEIIEIDYDYPAYIEGRGQGGYGTEQILEKYYGKNGYPDYISYAFNSGSEWLSSENGADAVAWYHEVGLTDMSEENQQAVLAVAAENCYVRFYQCTWSYNERKAVYDELCALGINAVMGRNTENIYVYVDDIDEYAELEKRYGGMVVLSDEAFAGFDYTITGEYGATGANTTGIASVAPAEGTEYEAHTLMAKTDTGAQMLFAGAGVVALAALAFLAVRRPKLSAGADGSAAIQQTINIRELIADSTEAPSAEVKHRIMSSIDTE